MKFHIMSDLHLDHCAIDLNKFDFEKDSVILLAGDASDSAYCTQFLGAVGREVNEVFHVLGNHEYYGQIYNKAANRIKWDLSEQFGRTSNIHVTEKDVYDRDDVVIITATLWTDFSRGNYTRMVQARNEVGDYTQIYSQDRPPEWKLGAGVPITPEFIYTEHQDHLAFIKEQLEIHAGRKIVIMTHHAPSNQSISSRHIGERSNDLFCSDLDYLMVGNPDIKLWVHGHTHQFKDYDIDGTRVICNPRGYQNKRRAETMTGFQYNFKVEI